MKCSASEPGLRSGKLQSLPEKIILCNLHPFPMGGLKTYKAVGHLYLQSQECSMGVD